MRQDCFTTLNPIMTFFTDYLEDQLNARNEEVYYLSEHVHSLELKLTDMESLEEKFDGLREALSASNSELLNLIKELESKELELRNSTSCLEKLDDRLGFICCSGVPM
ncbi:hypothetical protein U1Q18_042311 [Sarracenia purpurea var. burkii]